MRALTLACLIGLSLASLAYYAGDATPPAVVDPELQIAAPAVARDDLDVRGGMRQFDWGPVVLQVLARIRKVNKAILPRNSYDRDDPEMEVLVEKVYFGSPPGKSFRILNHVLHDELPADAERVAHVYYFSSTAIQTPLKYQLHRFRPIDQPEHGTTEKHLLALAQARLDLQVHESNSIFVGRPVKVKKDETTVRLERVLLGPRRRGEDVVLQGEEREAVPLPDGESYIYFTVPPAKYKSDYGRDGEILTHWSLATLDQVQASIARREKRLAERSTNAVEILYPGTRADAIDCLRSPNPAIQMLGARTLAREGVDAIPDLVAAIRAQLDRRPQSPPTPFDFASQANFIEALALLGGHRTDGEVVKLIRELLDHAEVGHAFPRNTAGDKPQHFDRYGTLDTVNNHSLAWLCLSLRPDDLLELFGERLLKLRDLAQYGWKDEAQLVIDLREIDDRLELRRVEPKCENVPVVRWRGGHEKSVLVAEFSEDDRELITTDRAGVQCRWNAANGELESRTSVTLPARDYVSPSDLDWLRAEDGKFWSLDIKYSFKETPTRVAVRIADGQPRKVEREIGSFNEPEPPGKLLGTIEPQWHPHPSGLVPGGQEFYLGVQFYSRHDLHLVTAINPAGWVRSMTFADDVSRYAIVTQEHWQDSEIAGHDFGLRDQGVDRLRVHDKRTNSLLFSHRTHTYVDRTAFSHDGKKVAAIYHDQEMEIWTLPSAK